MTKAFILAAGFGKRMQELSQDKPKALLPLAGYPLLAYTLFTLYLWEIKEVVINLHYKGNKIREFLKDFPHFPIHFSEEEKILETAGGIRHAMGTHKALKSTDQIILLNPDILIVPKAEDKANSKDLKEKESLLYLKKQNNFQEISTGFALKKEKDHFEEGKHAYPIFINTEKKEFYYIGYSLISLSSLTFLKEDEYYPLKKIWEKEASQNTLYGKIFQGDVWDLGEKEKYLKLHKCFKSPTDIFRNHTLGKKWEKFITSWKLHKI